MAEQPRLGSDTVTENLMAPTFATHRREVTFEFRLRLLHLRQLQVRSPELGLIAARHI